MIDSSVGCACWECCVVDERDVWVCADGRKLCVSV